MHGRGGRGEQMRTWLTGRFNLPDDCQILAPQAPNNTWYPQRFVVPKEENEPHLSHSLATLERLVRDLEKQGISHEHVVFFGFSQGACLISEYLKQNPARYGGAVIASGGVIGTDAEAEEQDSDGTLLQTPVYLGCDRVDAHIPEERVVVTERLLKKLGADVEMHLYDNLGHAVHPDAFKFLSAHVK